MAAYSVVEWVSLDNDVELVIRPKEDNLKETRGETRRWVSSKWLMSTTKYFQEWLVDTTFPENGKLEEEGFIQLLLSAPESDLEAFNRIIDMLYVYENGHLVETEVDFPWLHRIAMLVEKYHWHSVLSPAKCWFENLVESQGLPESFGSTLMSWLWVAWTMERRHEFNVLSKIAQHDAPRSIHLTDELGLPTRVLEAINARRLAAFKRIESLFLNFRKHLLSRKYQIHSLPAASKFLRLAFFGYATFYLQKLEFGEFAKPDFDGNSIRLLDDRVKSLPSMGGITVQDSDRSFGPIPPDSEFKSEAQRLISEVLIEDCGLDYDDFQPSFDDSLS